MRLLLDTHVALWAITDDPRLSENARALISSEDNDVIVSAASVWEISIKHALGGNRAGAMPISGRQAHGYFEEAGFISLPVAAVHSAAVDGLPGHHADPFDRIIVAQAIIEPMQLLTHDATLSSYTELVVAV